MRRVVTLVLLAIGAAGCDRLHHSSASVEDFAKSPPVDPGGGNDVGGGDPTGAGGQAPIGGDLGSNDVQAPVPEPATLALLGGGIAVAALLRRRRRAS